MTDDPRLIRDQVPLTPDQRQSALSAIRTETETEVSGVLGQQGYDAFKKNLGASSWLKSLSPDPKPTKKP